MADKRVDDTQLSASSYQDADHAPRHARLLDPSFWMPHDEDPEPWLQISLAERMIISAIVVDGQWKPPYGWLWVEQFYLTYSGNGQAWSPYVFLTEESDAYEFVQKVGSTD